MRKLFVFLLCLVGASAWSRPGNVSPTVSAGTLGGAVTYGTGAGGASFSRMVSASPGSAAQIIDNIRVGLPANAALEFAAGRIITRAALTAAVGIAVGTGVGAVAVTALPYLWDQLYQQGVEPKPGGGAQYDPGADPEPGYLYCGYLQGPGQCSYSSPTTAMGSWQPVRDSVCQNGITCTDATRSCTAGASPGQASCVWSVNRYMNNGQTSLGQVGVVTQTLYSDFSSTCREPSDINFPYKYGQKLCASDVRVSATPAVIGQAIADMPDTVTPGVVEELEPKLEIDKEPTKLSGPATVQAPNPTVTTRPNPVPGGDPIVESKSITHNITYNNNTYNYTTTTETTIDEEVVETVTETPAEDPKTDCEKFPESVGCLELGAVPEVTKPEKTIPISVAAAGNWGAGNAGCPAPRTVAFFGQTISIDNTLLCGFFGGIRFAVVGAFAMAATLIFIGGIGGGAKQ